MSVLDDAASGVWLVKTMTAMYEVDMDARTLRRRPLVNHDGEWEVAQLRKDSEVIPIVKVVSTVTPHLPMDFYLDIRGDGIYTWRQTTPVQQIHSPGTWS